MKFRDIQILNSGKYSEERLEQNKYLMFYWENIRNLFCMNFPDDIDLLGISKLNIQLGEFDGDPFIEPDNRGIAIFKMDGFSFDEFCELSDAEKDNTSLSYVKNALIAICDRFDVPSTVKEQIKNTAEIVRNGGFEQVKIHKKTSKWHKSKRMRAVTILLFKKGGIDAVLEIRDKSGEILSSHKIIESRFWEGVWFDLWKGEWRGNTFIIEGRTGENFFEVKCST